MEDLLMSEEMNLSPELELSEILRIRREKLADLRAEGLDPFEKVKYKRTNSVAKIIENFIKKEDLTVLNKTVSSKTVSIAGRLMSKRDMGKSAFFDLHDMSGKIQLYVNMKILGKESFERFLKFDIGDIVGVKGEIFRTNMGEISVRVKHVELLSKSLLPLPDKWHGLKDQDLRYRQRYVDLIVNPDVRKAFITRSKIIKAIRAFLDNRGFLEVETPLLNTVPGGATAKPFITHHNTLDMDMYLRIAPELYLKRLIVGGLEKVYEIGRMFRNEGISIKHNPEFTLMELYEAYTDYNGMMDITEQLISSVAKKVLGTTKIKYQGEEIDLTPPWSRLTMLEAIKQHTGVDFSNVKTAQEAKTLAEGLNIKIEKGNNCCAPSKGEIISLVFEERVEDKLLQPTFILDYPVEVSPLTKRKPDNKEYTERFELFIPRREMANAYSELNDPIDQKERFMKQMDARAAGDEEAQMLDDDYVTALEYGLPPTGGLGIGIDRLVMLLTDSFSIRDVLLFPTMRPKTDI